MKSVISICRILLQTELRADACLQRINTVQFFLKKRNAALWPTKANLCATIT